MKDIKQQKRKDVNKNEKLFGKSQFNNIKCFLNRCFIFIFIINKELDIPYFFYLLDKYGRSII